jgi:hypothetical protein
LRSWIAIAICFAPLAARARLGGFQADLSGAFGLEVQTRLGTLPNECKASGAAQ